MNNITIYNLLHYVEGDPYPDFGREDTRDTIESYEYIIIRMIKELQEVSKLDTDSEDMNASAEAAKESIVNINTVVKRCIREHIDRRMIDEIIR